MSRSLVLLKSLSFQSIQDSQVAGIEINIQAIPVRFVLSKNGDLFVTDPPYADAINYDEINEYFIAWLRQTPPKPFDKWTWDSRRH